MTTASKTLSRPRRLPEVPRLFQGLVLIALGFFLYSRLSNGTLFFYINQRFAWLTLAAALGLMLVGAAFSIRRSRDGHDHGHDHGDAEPGSGDSHDPGDDHESGHHHDPDHHHGPDHNHSHVTWLAIGLVTLPIVLGLLVPPQPLGAAAMAGREINFASLNAGAVAAGDRLRAPAGERNILDWLIAFQESQDPQSFVGLPATVVGFAFPTEQMAPDQAAGETFMVSRFVVSCCAADGTPVSLIVRWPEARALEADTWVEVTGVFEVAEIDGRSVPILVADAVKPVEQPQQPYLYP